MAKNDMFSSVLFRQKQIRLLIHFIKRLFFSRERTKLLFKKEKLLKFNFFLNNKIKYIFIK
jgi:hypothetical protein